MDGKCPDNPIRSISFGRGAENITLENNLFQAPLAGYSGLPFRLLSWQWGRPGLLATEMISANALRQNPGTQSEYMLRSPEEGPVAFQIFGADPNIVALAAVHAQEAGADVIDLNCGCPVRKVRAGGAGSKLMENPLLIGRIISAMRRAITKPLTLKIRVGVDAEHFNGAEIAHIAEDAGADLVTVHGRHAKESYATPCRYERIREVVEAVTIPVIGNGDVRDGESARRMFYLTGCAGVMVGRACMGAPWVFARIKEECAGRMWTPITLPVIGKTLLEHCDRLSVIMGEDKAVRHCRKLGAFYAKGFAGAKDFRAGLNYCLTRENLAALVVRLVTGVAGIAWE